MTDNFRDNEDRHRFELDVEGTIAFVTYRKSPRAITLVLPRCRPNWEDGESARSLGVRPLTRCGLKDGNSLSNAISSDRS
jgi:hypothetical protein